MREVTGRGSLDPRPRALLEAPMPLALPPLARVLTERTPPVIVVAPV